MKKSWLVALVVGVVGGGGFLVGGMAGEVKAQSAELIATSSSELSVDVSANLAEESLDNLVATDSAELVNKGEWYDDYLVLAEMGQRFFQVEPARMGDDYSLVMQPGESRVLQFTLTNNGDKSYYSRVLVRNFSVGDNGESLNLRTEHDLGNEMLGEYGLADWVSVGREWTQLTAGEKTRVNLTVEVPEDARPGGHYAMLLVQPWEKLPREGVLIDNWNDVEMTDNPPPAQIGALIYVVVSPEEIPVRAQVLNFKFDPFKEQGPVNFSFKITNLSEVHLRPTGRIVVRDWWGREVADLAIAAQNIYPGESGEYKGSFDQKWGMGNYRAYLEIEEGWGLVVDGEEKNGEMLVMAETTFWLFPIRLVALIGIAMAMVVVWLLDVRARKKLKKKSKIEKNKL